MTQILNYRPAQPSNAPILRNWDEQPHVVDCDPNTDDWNWEEELAEEPDWREQWMVSLGDRPMGFLQIIDPDLEESHYWGETGPGYRAIDIWIGESDLLGLGYGTQMMEFAIKRCFDPPGVHSILIDPLTSNERAIRFYQRLGFEFLEIRQFGEDECSVHLLTRKNWQARKDHLGQSSGPSHPVGDSL